MKAREIGNMALHMGVGGLLAAAVAWNYWTMIPVTFLYAFLREQAQHRFIIERYFADFTQNEIERTDVGNVFTVEKETFFGWITGHRIWEVFQWVIGAEVACGIYAFVQWEWLT